MPANTGKIPPGGTDASDAQTRTLHVYADARESQFILFQRFVASFASRSSGHDETFVQQKRPITSHYRQQWSLVRILEAVQTQDINLIIALILSRQLGWPIDFARGAFRLASICSGPESFGFRGVLSSFGETIRVRRDTRTVSGLVTSVW